MSQSGVVLMLVVFAVFGIGLAAAAILERTRNRRVLGKERARGRNSDPDKGPAHVHRR